MPNQKIESPNQAITQSQGEKHDDGNLKQISMTISTSDLERVDVAAKKKRISRAAFIRLAIIAALPDEV